MGFLAKGICTDGVLKIALHRMAWIIYNHNCRTTLRLNQIHKHITYFKPKKQMHLKPVLLTYRLEAEFGRKKCEKCCEIFYLQYSKAVGTSPEGGVTVP
jgi:hypothetical protein